MSSFAAEDILADRVKFLMEDTVYLDTSMKNLIAKVFGQYTTQDRSFSFSNNSNPQVVYKDIMSSARLIIQAFNSHSLLSYEEWAEANPQSEESSCDARFQELISYKAAHYLKKKVHGAKYSKSLGRRYLQATGVWISSVLPAAQAAAAASTIEENVFLYFSTEFGLSLQDGYVDADLVWSSDFQKTLAGKQVKRAELEKAAAANYDSSPLRTPGVTVEEIL